MTSIQPHEIVTLDGALIVRMPPVFLVRLTSYTPEASFDVLLKEMANGLETRPPGARMAVLFDLQGVNKPNATRRKQMAEFNAQHADVLAQPKTAIAVVTNSPLVQGLVRAVWWVAPLPCPSTIVRDTRSALEFLSAQVDGVDVDACLKALRRHALGDPAP